ncbi:MAG: hypothetical protein IPJ13_19295 [Saprospiraceae bacterium]|nr:hypothetical protein [Saprospiraceae bacterium]
MAITLVNEDEMYKFAAIEKLIDTTIVKLPIPAYIGQSPEWSLSRPKK